MRATLNTAILVAALMAVATPALAQEPSRPLPIVCELVVNQRSEGDVTIFAAGGDYWITVDDLARLGLRTERGLLRSLQDRPHVALSSLAPFVTGRFDEREVRLTITATAGAYAAKNTLIESTPPTVRSRPFSAFLNYGSTLRDRGGSSMSAELGMTVLGRFFVRTTAAGATNGRLYRGESSITLDDERRLVRWVAGDNVIRSGWSGRTSSFAGLTVGRQFGIDPAFLTSGPLSMSGSTAVPATAEVYVNGQLVRRAAVEPGSFEFRDIAPTIGAGEVRVLVRDELGRTQEMTASFYRSPSVLRDGLHEFRYTAGLQRVRVGPNAWTYHGLVGSATHRVGLTRYLTLGGAFDVSDAIANGGASLAVATRAGDVEASAFLSRTDSERGRAGALAYAFRGRAFDFYGKGRWASRHFRELGQSNVFSDARDSRGVDAGAGLTLPRGLRLGAAYGVSDDHLGTLRFLNLTAQIGIGPAHFWVLANRTQSGSWTGSATVAWALGARRSAATSVVSDGQRTDVAAAVRQNLPAGAGIGYELQWQGAARAASVQTELQHSAGRLLLRHDNSPAYTSSMANIAGAVAFVGRTWHVTRPIDDAFALVRVGGVPGVRTYVSNQLVGKTNRRGEILVPALSSFYPNRVSISDRDIPISYEVGAVESEISPALRGGNIVTFDVTELRLLSGRLVLPAAAANDVTALVRWPGREERIRVNGDGSFLFERAIPGRHVMHVRGDSFACLAAVTVRLTTAGLAEQQVGDVLCVPAFPLGLRLK